MAAAAADTDGQCGCFICVDIFTTDRALAIFGIGDFGEVGGGILIEFPFTLAAAERDFYGDRFLDSFALDRAYVIDCICSESLRNAEDGCADDESDEFYCFHRS